MKSPSSKTYSKSIKKLFSTLQNFKRKISLPKLKVAHENTKITYKNQVSTKNWLKNSPIATGTNQPLKMFFHSKTRGDNKKSGKVHFLKIRKFRLEKPILNSHWDKCSLIKNPLIIKWYLTKKLITTTPK